jgi:lipoate---protein ligase
MGLATLLAMIFLDNRAVTDPCINLAIEEYLLRQETLAQPVLLLYNNGPSVIVGRNQNVLEEVDLRYAQAQGIQIVRRMSGGGAVYHDLGNLNFSTVTPGREDLHNFARFTAPVIGALAGLGLQVELRQRSSLFIGDKKISGNAQYATGGRLLSHGTLLFDSDLERLARVLSPPDSQVESKAVRSVRNQVTNIRPLLTRDLSAEQLRQALLEAFLGGSDIPVRSLDEQEWDRVHEIAHSRYRQWDWNLGRSPRSSLAKSLESASGRLHARLVVTRGCIDSVHLSAESMALPWLAELEAKLVGVRYDPEHLAQRLADLDLPPGPGSSNTSPSRAELLELLY